MHRNSQRGMLTISLVDYKRVPGIEVLTDVSKLVLMSTQLFPDYDRVILYGALCIGFNICKLAQVNFCILVVAFI